MGEQSNDADSFRVGRDIPTDIPPVEETRAAISDTSDLDQSLDQAFPQDVARVGDTEIDNFGESVLTTSVEVQNYIENSIPPDHLEGLSEIEFVNDPDAYNEGLMGMWAQDPSTGDTVIQVFPHDDKAELYDTIAHETGHNVETILEQQNADTVAAWNQMYDQGIANLIASGGEQNGFVSPYALSSPEEDFAESYATYINDPSLLQAVSQDKYDFMAHNCFLTVA